MNASAHIPDDSDLAEKIKDRADKFHDGKVSAFVRSCIVKELEGSFAPTSDDALVDLARAFHPTLAPVIADRKIKNPGRVIAKLLEALVEALDQKSFNADKAFHLSNFTEVGMAAAMPGVLRALLASQVGFDEADKIITRISPPDTAANLLGAIPSTAEPHPPSNTDTVLEKLTNNATAHPAPRADK